MSVSAIDEEFNGAKGGNDDENDDMEASTSSSSKQESHAEKKRSRERKRKASDNEKVELMKQQRHMENLELKKDSLKMKQNFLDLMGRMLEKM